MEFDEEINHIEDCTQSLNFIYRQMPPLVIRTKQQVECFNRDIYLKVNQIPTSLPLINTSDLQLLKSPFSYQQSTSPSVMGRTIPSPSQKLATLHFYNQRKDRDPQDPEDFQNGNLEPDTQKILDKQTSLEIMDDRDLEKQLLIQSTLRSRKSKKMSNVKSVSPANSEEEENASHQFSYNSSKVLQLAGHGILKNSQQSLRSIPQSISSSKKVRFSIGNKIPKSPFRDLLRESNPKYTNI